jgi:hypothetical protein
MPPKLHTAAIADDEQAINDLCADGTSGQFHLLPSSVVPFLPHSALRYLDTVVEVGSICPHETIHRNGISRRSHRLAAIFLRACVCMRAASSVSIG